MKQQIVLCHLVSDRTVALAPFIGCCTRNHEINLSEAGLLQFGGLESKPLGGVPKADGCINGASGCGVLDHGTISVVFTASGSQLRHIKLDSS